MFILILFGYKQYKVFTTDVLGYTLLDCIWNQAIKEINKTFTIKEEQHSKDLKECKAKINTNEKEITEINIKLQEEGLYDPNKKDDKKAAKAPPKKGKEVIPNNPNETRKLELTKENEKLAEYITKYEDKIAKLKATSDKFKELNERYQHEQLVIELCDRTGERKFVKTKLDQQANTFLTDKSTYILAYLQQPQTPDDEEQVLALEYEGYLVRTVDEDVGVVDEPLIQMPQKKDDKKKKKK